MRIVLHVAGKDLDDALIFNRLRADLKKLCASHQVIVVHNADAQFQTELRRRGLADQTQPEHRALYETVLVQLNKTIVAKLSEELLPAIAMTGNHLGLIQAEPIPREEGHFPFTKIVRINASILERQISGGSIPVVAPLAMDKSDTIQPVRSEHVAAKVASALKADLLIFLLEPNGYMENGKPVSTLHPGGSNIDSETGKIASQASQSLKEGTKRAFLTKLGSMEKLIFEGITVPTEILT
ncbi:MAG: hypothetical protein HGB19_07860 [Chlorobiales bacterium]|jgi:acetylglutamate kinase|nr:hypothetical protein [Chlorobiales bacterium]